MIGLHYELLLFDADGTLFDFDKTEEACLRQALHDHGFPYSHSIYREYRRINRSMWERLEKGEITQKELKTARFQALFDFLEVQTDPEFFCQRFLSYFGDHPYLIEGAENLCRDLFHKKYRLAIITNGLKDSQRARLEQSSIAEYFKYIFISEELGYTKPDPEYFDLVMRKMSPSDRKRTLIIGDSLSADIQGGNNSKIDTCWFNPLQLENPTRAKPVYQIAHLDEIRDIV